MDANRSSQADINRIAHMHKKRKLKDELPEMPLPKKIQTNQLPEGSDSDPESTNSNSFNFNSDSIVSTDDEAQTDYLETCSSDMHSTSSSSYSSEVNPSRSPTNSNSSEGRNGEVGSGSEFSLLGYGKDDIEELENVLYPNEGANSNYILSSGRWSVNKEGEEEGKKLTIDEEFEQYFSMLML